MIKVLSLGNSFSQDAQRYLHDISNSDSVGIKCVNLYIGGCSLSTHYKHMNNDASSYAFEYNGIGTGIFVSFKEAMQSDQWDYITFQQASHFSVDYNTYFPYLEHLSEYAHFHAPKSKQLMHQTWAYQHSSDKLADTGFSSHNEMFSALDKCYKKAAASISADGIIPSGYCMKGLADNEITDTYRDGFHAGLGIGRYALGLTWYGFLTGNNIENISFNKFDKPAVEADILMAKKCALKAIERI